MTWLVCSPRDVLSPGPETRTWKRVTLAGNVEGYLTSDGTTYVRARADEPAEVRVTFMVAGLPPLLLVRAEASVTITRAEKAERRERRALRARGYDA